MQRFARAGSRADLIACATLLERAPSKDDARTLMTGFELAFEGRPLSALPDRLVKAIAASGGGSLPLRVRQGDDEAVAEALAIIADSDAEADARLELIRTIGEIRDQRGIPSLVAVASTEGPEPIRAAALAALRPFDDSKIARVAIDLHDDLPPEAREAAQELLVGRRPYASALLDAIAGSRVDRSLVPESIARKILLLGDDTLSASAREIWGDLGGESTEHLRQAVQRLEGIIAAGSGNPYTGKEIYLQSCGKCHTLFDSGGDVGPNLTSYQRGDLRSMLTAVVDPSAEVREGYETYLALMLDGRVVTGFLVDRDDRVVVLRGADGRNEVLPQDEIEELAGVPQSVMPAGLLDPLSDQQVRDLFAYLRSTQPLNN
jgi:putative heme-binding domain-containing protein